MRMVARRPAVGLAADPDQDKAVAQSIAYHALTMLIQDTKGMVRKAVSTQLKEGLRSANPRTQRHTKNRSDALTKWEKSEVGLTWNGPQTEGGYAALLIILNDDPNTHPSQLKHSQDGWTYDHVAEHLMNMANGSSTISAPALKDGAFINALPIAARQISDYAPDEHLQKEFCVQIFSTMMRKMKIHFLPWHRDGVGRSSPRAVRVDCWMVINRNTDRHRSDKGKEKVIDLTLEEEMESVATTLAASNPTAPWTIPTHLSEMGSLWNKTVRPDDWDLEQASLSHARAKSAHEYVWKTYEYVEKVYDGTLWQHHMALVWAILFSRVTPNLFHTKPTNLDRISDSKEISRRIRSLPWIGGTSKNHKGVTARTPYITMLSTAIIALRDPNSPLSIRAAGKSNSLGVPWTDKHGEW
jgi:hypothetical protein